MALAAPRLGQARTATVATQLDYAAAPGCPDVDVFQGIVRRRLGYDTFRADAPNLVVVRIESAGRALEGQIEWRNAAGVSIGEQTFPSRSGDCGELTLAMGFALALQIQLLASTAPDHAEPPPPAPAPPVASAPPPPVSAPAARLEMPAPPPSTAPAGPALSVGLGAAAGFGVSSDATALGRLFVTAAWPHLALELAGEASAPATTHRSDGAGFSQEELLASLAACWVHGPLHACAVGKMGEVRVRGQNVDDALTASGVMIQTGLRLAFVQPLGQRTYMAARAESLARVTEGTVTLDSTPVWTTPRFAALLGIDVGVRFR